MFRVKIKVKLNSSKQSIEKEGEIYLVNVKSSPDNNKANNEVIKLLEKHFKKPVKMKFGFKGKNKILEVGE